MKGMVTDECVQGSQRLSWQPTWSANQGASEKNLFIALFVDRIAGSADGADKILAAMGVQRLPQTPDMDVDGPRLDENIATPDPP
jgi:hypothetical protein